MTDDNPDSNKAERGSQFVCFSKTSEIYPSTFRQKIYKWRHFWTVATLPTS